jgi:hypothetical protein
MDRIGIMQARKPGSAMTHQAVDVRRGDSGPELGNGRMQTGCYFPLKEALKENAGVFPTLSGLDSERDSAGAVQNAVWSDPIFC